MVDPESGRTGHLCGRTGRSYADVARVKGNGLCSSIVDAHKVEPGGIVPVKVQDAPEVVVDRETVGSCRVTSLEERTVGLEQGVPAVDVELVGGARSPDPDIAAREVEVSARVEHHLVRIGGEGGVLVSDVPPVRGRGASEHQVGVGGVRGKELDDRPSGIFHSKEAVPVRRASRGTVVHVQLRRRACRPDPDVSRIRNEKVFRTRILGRKGKPHSVGSPHGNLPIGIAVRPIRVHVQLLVGTLENAILVRSSFHMKNGSGTRSADPDVAVVLDPEYFGSPVVYRNEIPRSLVPYPYSKIGVGRALHRIHSLRLEIPADLEFSGRIRRTDPDVARASVVRVRSGLRPDVQSRHVDVLPLDHPILRPVGASVEDLGKERPDGSLRVRHAGRERGVGRLDAVHERALFRHAQR